jgi:hypothetical protein
MYSVNFEEDNNHENHENHDHKLGIEQPAQKPKGIFTKPIDSETSKFFLFDLFLLLFVIFFNLIRPDSKQEMSFNIPSHNSASIPSCDTAVALAVKRVQQEFSTEKDRIQRLAHDKCSTQKQQLTNQLTQKHALDLSFIRQDLIKEYQFQKEVLDKTHQLQCHRENEEIRKDLLSKYREEESSLRLELEKRHFQSLQTMKEEVIAEISSESGETEAEKAFNYWKKDFLLQHQTEKENFEREKAMNSSFTCNNGNNTVVQMTPSDCSMERLSTKGFPEMFSLPSSSFLNEIDQNILYISAFSLVRILLCSFFLFSNLRFVSFRVFFFCYCFAGYYSPKTQKRKQPRRQQPLEE